VLAVRACTYVNRNSWYSRYGVTSASTQSSTDFTTLVPTFCPGVQYAETVGKTLYTRVADKTAHKQRPGLSPRPMVAVGPARQHPIEFKLGFSIFMFTAALPQLTTHSYHHTCFSSLFAAALLLNCACLLLLSTQARSHIPVAFACSATLSPVRAFHSKSLAQPYSCYDPGCLRDCISTRTPRRSPPA